MSPLPLVRHFYPETGPAKPAASASDDFPPEIDEKAQPEGEDGVMEDMATLAINPVTAPGPGGCRRSHHVTGRFWPNGRCRNHVGAARGDNAGGFDFLIQNYRKPIIHFMYRMVRQSGRCRRAGPRGFSADVPVTRDLPRRGAVLSTPGSIGLQRIWV